LPTPASFNVSRSSFARPLSRCGASGRRDDTPSPELAAELAAIDGDLIILGVGGKIGPDAGANAKRAAPEEARRRRCTLQRKGLRETLTSMASSASRPICSIAPQIDALPKLPNVVFMAGFKFGRIRA
jgi:hypothetical protein